MDSFLVSLDKGADKPLYEQLYIGIKEAIIKQQMPTGTKLPSKRQLADFLNISQTTVELSYAQLLAEGYISSKSRIGFFVEAVDELPYVEKADVTIDVAAPTVAPFYTYDFSPGKIDEDAFPFSVWRKYAKGVIDESSKALLQIGHRQGEHELRQQISLYLYQSRGIICTPEQIVVGSGTEQLLPMILRLLGDNSKLALENPGYSAIPRIHLKNRAIPITVDEDGLVVDKLDQTDANLVYITPSHQFPTGAVLSAARRTQLLKWATSKAGRYIIEDDYDSEFRYIGKPIPALQGLDQNGTVIYMSTFTKSLMPSLRVAYFVLPAALVPNYKENFHYYSSTVPRFEQHILANFMRDGHFAKHLNRMRKIYRKKHDKLIQVLTKHYPSVAITGDIAGMHILISVPHNKTSNELKQLAADSSIHLYTIDNYLLKSIHYEHPTFLLGFGGLALDDIEPAIHTLMTCFNV